MVHFGRRVTELDESGARPSLLLEDGSPWSGEFIVAADGIRCRIRSLIFPGQLVNPVVSDLVTFQFMIRRSAMESHKHLRELYRTTSRSGSGPGHYVCCGAPQHARLLHRGLALIMGMVRLASPGDME